jgi:hypothetical protein
MTKLLERERSCVARSDVNVDTQLLVVIGLRKHSAAGMTDSHHDAVGRQATTCCRSGSNSRALKRLA